MNIQQVNNFRADNKNQIILNPSENINKHKFNFNTDDNLGVNKNILYEKHKKDFENHPIEKDKKIVNDFLDDIFEDKSKKLTFHPKISNKEKSIRPEYSDYDVYDPEYEIFNPNYQIDTKKFINPNSGDGDIPDKKNPFFSTNEEFTQEGELVGPNSDIFSKEHPHMTKKPGMHVRYDPIGPFGTHGADEESTSGKWVWEY